MQFVNDACFGRFMPVLRLFGLEGLGGFLRRSFGLVSFGLVGLRRLRGGFDRRRTLDIFRCHDRLLRFRRTEYPTETRKECQRDTGASKPAARHADLIRYRSPCGSFATLRSNVIWNPKWLGTAVSPRGRFQPEISSQNCSIGTDHEKLKTDLFRRGCCKRHAWL